MIDILSYIPFGKDNAVTRGYLCRVTGLTDRDVRELICKARHNTPIINLQNGGGYFRPTEQEKRYVERWVSQEKKRAKSVFWSMKGARDFIRRA